MIRGRSSAEAADRRARGREALGDLGRQRGGREQPRRRAAAVLGDPANQSGPPARPRAPAGRGPPLCGDRPVADAHAGAAGGPTIRAGSRSGRRARSRRSPRRDGRRGEIAVVDQRVGAELAEALRPRDAGQMVDERAADPGAAGLGRTQIASRKATGLALAAVGVGAQADLGVAETGRRARRPQARGARRGRGRNARRDLGEMLARRLSGQARGAVRPDLVCRRSRARGSAERHASLPLDRAADRRRLLARALAGVGDLLHRLVELAARAGLRARGRCRRAGRDTAASARS